MKKLILILIVSIFTIPIAYAYEIKIVNEVYKRPGGSAIAESEMLTVHFIDVGGGDAILIDTPSDKKILIDGGFSWRERTMAIKEYRAYIDNILGNDVVDLIVITHPDYDHFGGLPEVLNNYVVRQVWASGYDSEKLSSSWNMFKQQLEDDENTLFVSPLGRFYGLGSVVRFDNGGTYDKSDDTTLTIINTKQWLPPKAYGNPNRTVNDDQKRNSTSIVLRLDYGKTSFLFTGDVNGRKKDADINAIDDQEKFMVDNNNNVNTALYNLLDVDVLKVAHHGSNGSSSLPFLKAVSPTWAVISAGFPNGHPDNDVIVRLKNSDVGLNNKHILRTDDEDDDNGTTKANEANLGDDCYVFTIDPEGIVKIEKWNIKIF